MISIGMSKKLRILIGDPGVSPDFFGVLGQEGTWPDKKIYTRHAQRFKKKPDEPKDQYYARVAYHFHKLHNKLNFDLIILEKNFDYENVSKAFANLPITYVTTLSQLTAKTRQKGFSIDKNFMINWLKKEYTKHTIQLPSIYSDEIKELINQRNEISGITGPSGHTSFKRQRGRHDDLFMPELIGCNAIRIWWDENG